VQPARALFVVGVTLLSSCTDELGPADASSTQETQLDEATLALAAGYKAFTQVNTRTDASQVGSFDINVYVTGDVATYEQIHPESTTTVPALGIGTLIVREVLAADGSVSRLTMMAKGPPGYDPSLGDWWFAEADAQCQPVVDNGVLEVGQLVGDCHSCHIPRQSEDYLFGVPAADMN
jgi:hypothetical protein